MKHSTYLVLLSKVMSYLARSGDELSVGDIAHKCRGFRKRHRITNPQLFVALEQMVSEGYLRRIFSPSGRIIYGLSIPMLEKHTPTISQPAVSELDKLEMGTAVKTIDQSLVEAAKRYAAQKIKEKQDA